MLDEIFSQFLIALVLTDHCCVWPGFRLAAVWALNGYGLAFVLPMMVQVLNCLEILSAAFTVSLGRAVVKDMLTKIF